MFDLFVICILLKKKNFSFFPNFHCIDVLFECIIIGSTDESKSDWFEWH